MKISVDHGEIQESRADSIIVNLFEGSTGPGGATGAVDQALAGAISELIANGDFTGKEGEIGIVHPRGAIPARRVLVAGLGKRDEFHMERARITAAVALAKARDLNARNVATIVHGAGLGGQPVEAAAQATAEGSLLALYRYAAAKRQEEALKEIETLTIVEHDSRKIEAVEAAVKTAEAIAAGTYLARDLVNMPPNVATPSKLAKTAQHISETHGMKITIGGRKWAAKRNMGAFLAVARGAGEPPKFIVLEHNGDREDLDTIVLVGKGITFDTGGISIKPARGMGAMKADMGGAAAVLGTMKVVGLLDLPLRVIGITPCTENMPDAHAYRPSDVITASNGKSIEIISTDAEGRMVLADGLVYADRYHPEAVIDLATLTGSCVIALGRGMAAGLFSTNDGLRDKLVSASIASHERVWPMPLWDDYRESIASDVADMKNSGDRYSGVASSAIFLKEFTDYSWAHLDIAGLALSEEGRPYSPAGATGYGVRLLVEFLRRW